MAVAMNIVVKGVRDVQRNLKRIDQQKRKAMDKQTKLGALRALRLVQRMYTRGPLHVRSDTLRGSVHVSFRETKDGLHALCGTPTKYAITHEQGNPVFVRSPKPREIITGRRVDGTLRTRMSRGTHLAFPLPGSRAAKIANTRANVRRGMKNDEIALKLSRGKPFTTFVSKSGRAVMMMVKGWAEPETILVLKQRVKMPKRAVWGRVTKHLQKRLPRDVSDNIRQVIRRAA